MPSPIPYIILTFLLFFGSCKLLMPVVETTMDLHDNIVESEDITTLDLFVLPLEEIK